MVQDQYEPEYFVGSFEEVHTATGQRARVDVSYMDSIPQRTGFVNEYEGPGAKTMERLVSVHVFIWLKIPAQPGAGILIILCYLYGSGLWGMCVWGG